MKQIDKGCLNRTLHLAFQTADGGYASIIVWHTIKLMRNVAWSEFIDRLHYEALVRGLNKLSFCIAARDCIHLHETSSYPVILHSALQLMPEDEYERVAEYIMERMPEVSDEQK